MTNPAALDRLAARQRKEQVFTQARREHLAPMQAERAGLIKTLETTLANFMAGALPDLTEASLAPFEQAAKDNMLETGPTALATKLRRQSEHANKLCQRYEREFNIYHMAEYLPDEEKKLADARSRLADTQRSYERLEVELEPLTPLNEKLASLGYMPVTAETAASFTRTTGAAHYLRLLRDKTYRTAWPVISAIETSGESITAKLRQRLVIQQELLVQEQAAELQDMEVQRQRCWVEAFVVAWTSRLSEKQILAEVRQAMADYMHEPGFRTSIAARFERRFPATLEPLFDKIGDLDKSTRRFIIGFDANYDAGRIEIDEELASRQRIATSV